jgi:hypothetical protein
LPWPYTSCSKAKMIGTGTPGNPENTHLRLLEAYSKSKPTHEK